MNKRNSLLQYIRLSNTIIEAAEDLSFDENALLQKAKQSIHNLICSWCEGMDLASADTARPTSYLKIFEMLFVKKGNLTYYLSA